MVRKLPIAGWDFADSKPGMYLQRKSDKWVFRKSVYNVILTCIQLYVALKTSNL
jgi:hypothetical protein